MIRTRWSPTPNGPIHLGHIYSLLVNEHFSHSVGGKFYIRFDDTSQAMRIEIDHQERIPSMIDGHQDIINWLDIRVDAWENQSVGLESVKSYLKRYDNIFPDPYPHYLPTYVRMMGTGWLPYPYTPTETAERVIFDERMGITHIIRGEEFSTEYSLYRYYCQMFGVKPPQFIFLPRLVGRCGDISKTNGGYSLVELRAKGYTPDDIKNLLAEACLIYFGDDWSLWNLKPNPRVNL